MHSLFWKFFVSFWLALVLFAGLSLWATSYYLEIVRAEETPDRPRQRLHEYVDEAQTIAAQDGLPGLRQWLEQLDRREAIPFYLIDQHGDDLLQRNIPTRIRLFWQTLERPAAAMHPDERNEFRPRRHLLIHVGDQHYWLMPDYQSVTLGRLLHRPRVIAVPLLVAMLVSALVCLLLARYLTAPISQLRRATQQLAAGNLDQRVTPSMGRRQDEIAALARDFDHMAEQLQRLLASHQQLLRDASHELRSPLARLQVVLGLARQRENNTITTELDRIEREAENLNELIGQLLTLARFESNHSDIPKEEVDLIELLQAIVKDAAFEASASQKQVKLKLTGKAMVRGRTILLHSAIENVVRNAIRHTPTGSSVELDMQLDPHQPGWIILQVQDHGSGVPEPMLTRIFDPFVRVSEARDRHSGGYGLGLAIAKRAIVFHGGEISAQNNPQGGLTIVMRLPITQ